MSLIDEISGKALELRKAKDPLSAALTTLKGQIQTEQKKLKTAREMTDEEVIAVIKSTLKKVQENIATFSQRNLPDALASANAEKELLEAFLPAQMSEQEIIVFVTPLIEAGSPMGQVMSALKAQKTGLYDGRTASSIVKRLLAS